MASGFGCMVVGPAGSGKSTLCHAIQEIAEQQGRTIKVCNLDPAAEVFKYKCDIDIRDLVSLDDVQEMENWGPNGGLVYCMEHLVDNVDWLLTELQEFSDDCFVLFDCPGQIELYSHLNVMQRLANAIQKSGMNICAVYCADGTYINEPTKYISCCLTSVSTMIQMSVPHLNVLTKCDKIQDKELIEKFTSAQSCADILGELGHYNSEQAFFNKKFLKLNQALVGIIDGFSLVNYQPVDITEEDSINDVIMQIDGLVQYDDYRMPNDKKFLDEQDPVENDADY